MFNLLTLKKTYSLLCSQISIRDPAVYWRLIVAIILMLSEISIASLLPYYSKIVINYLAANTYQLALITTCLIGSFWALEKIINFIQDIIFFPIINTTIKQLFYKSIQHVHNISLLDYQKLSIAELINCMRRISISARLFIKILFLLVIPTIIKLIIATIIATKMTNLGLLLLPGMLCTMFILYKGTAWYTKARALSWQITDQVTTRTNDSMLNTKIVRSFESFEMEQLDQLLTTEAKYWYQTNTKLNIVQITTEALMGIIMTIILVITVVAIKNNSLSVGDFILLKGQLIAVFLPFRLFAMEFRQVAEVFVDIKKIIQLFEIPVAAIKPKTKIQHQYQSKQQYIIYGANISFAHEQQQRILNNLSFQINVGQKIGIIGKTGCGKSTLLNLIAGLYLPTTGIININQSNLLHYIPQDLRLFNTSLLNNLTYGIKNTELNMDNLLNILKKLELIALIKAMPLGLDTIIGEMGTKLSGGEKQKIALARALLLKPDILLLDEATNFLNAKAEQKILAIIYATIPTVIITSHRKSTLFNLDRIFKIKQGNLQELTIKSKLPSLIF